MKLQQLFYIAAIVLIWFIVLYFFIEIYSQTNSSLGKSDSFLSFFKSSSSSSSNQLSTNKHLHPHHLIPSRSNISNPFNKNFSPFEPLIPISINTKSLHHITQDPSSSSSSSSSSSTNSNENTTIRAPKTPKEYAISRVRQSQVAKSAKDYKVASSQGVSWEEFVRQPIEPLVKGPDFPIDPTLITCSKEAEQKLHERLSQEQLDWCQWALSPTGGKVQVGKSYGNLQAKDREKYEKLNCNNVAKGENPSCDDAWGDSSILYWKKNILPDLCGDPNQYGSKVICRQSNSLAKFCIFENIVLDFTKMQNIKRPSRSDSRKWEKGFLSTHCDVNEHRDIDYYEFYEAAVNRDATRCHYVINETVVVYGHDDIKNLGHSMSDFMNVWAMLWLGGLGNYAKDISFLNMDAIRQGHNYYDDLGKFSRHYELQFARILKAKDFTGPHNVCIKRLLFMPRPVILFTWDGWWMDMPCTFAGPSSLYQRWNLQVRQLYGLYPLPKEYISAEESGKIKILLIKRTVKGGATSMYTSRVIQNMEDIEKRIRQQFSDVLGELIIQDLAELSFEEQIRLISKVHMIIGVHGAGVPTSMHMSIGRANCCGVIEIFPAGEFRPIRGYGNMARRVGHHYRRLDVDSQWSGGNGVTVPVDQLVQLTKEIIDAMKVKPTCVLPSVVNDPYFDSVSIPADLMKISN